MAKQTYNFLILGFIFMGVLLSFFDASRTVLVSYLLIALAVFFIRLFTFLK